MSFRSLVISRLAVQILVVLAGCTPPSANWKPITLKELAIEVTGSSREVAFTNKQAGFYYTETNAEHRSSWQGWTVMAKKIMDDYRIKNAGLPLRKTDVSVSTVYPDGLKRLYRSGAEETFTFLDSVDAFVVQLENLKASSLTIRPLFRDLRRPEDYIVKFQDGVLLVARKGHLERTTQENYPVWIGIFVDTSVQGSYLIPHDSLFGSNFSPGGIGIPLAPKNVTIVFVAGDSVDQVTRLAHVVSRDYSVLIAQRRQRMENLLNRSFARTDDERFDKALHWTTLSMDALIMNQVRKGIFAGLPWFDNYWGRDSFISLPGATLVSGDFADAREILRSFAEWQELDMKSPNYGRIPNLVTTGSIAFNTTDGTPRFVVALEQYLRYSNDTAFVKELYPTVKRSIEGALANHVDQHGFLKHGDAETWMDAVGPAGPWSPRGDRADDVQALWYHQLKAGALFARLKNDDQSARLWEKIATAVRVNFNKFYPDSSGSTLADYLHPNGAQDRQLRPNQLFAFDIVDNRELRARMFKTVTEGIVYPCGVASLSQDDSNFHPYHHYQPYYVQDAAYHNGIVWTWLAGAWIDVSTSYGLSDLAFKVTDNMAQQILDRGAVGTLSELLDAVPRPGEVEPRLSGTFSQAWSLAEFLRVFHQDYLGIKVDAPNKTISCSPRLPSLMHEARFTIAVGQTKVDASYSISSSDVVLTLQSKDMADSLTIIFDALVQGTREQVSSSLPPNKQLKIALLARSAEVTLDGKTDKVGPTIPDEPSPRIKLTDIKLATPFIRPNLNSLQGPPYRLLSNAEIKMNNAKAITLYDFADPERDDNGSGRYSYPLTPLLRPGSLDITHFTVSTDDRNAYFRLRFRDLSNPGWHPEYGFQLTYAAIAIDKDNKPGSGQIAVGMNSNYFIDPKFAYETIIYVGGGVRIADSKGTILAEYRPIEGDEKNPFGNAQQKSIDFALPIDIIGRPSANWHYTVLVGCQDDHGGAGLGDFRSVEATAKEWVGGGKKTLSDPNVYDIITPIHH